MPVRFGGNRSFDAASSSRYNETHWSNAAGEDPNALISADLPTLRNRARYEARNNCYSRGIIDTLANDVVGSGPRVQIISQNKRFNKKVEREFTAWMREADITGRLSLGDMARLAIVQLCESGEALVIKQNYEPAANVKLRLAMIEPDRLETPYGVTGNQERDQGIEYDKYGRPSNYYILKNHPGSNTVHIGSSVTDADKVPAGQVMHVYKMDRPGQRRGIPWIAPALPLFALLRRFTLASVRAAETAANFAGVMESTSPDLQPTDADDNAFDPVELEAGSLLTLPLGWKASQMKSEQPATTYDMFKAEIINEIGRPLNMSYNVAAANSSGYNYASGRLDWQVYYRFIKTVRTMAEMQILNKVLYSWLLEARSIVGLVDPALILKSNITINWYWPGTEPMDPVKEANAQKIRLEMGIDTYADACAVAGKDWEKQFEQRVKEKERKAELGLDQGIAPPAEPAGQEEDTEEEEAETEEDTGGNGKLNKNARIGLKRDYFRR